MILLECKQKSVTNAIRQLAAAAGADRRKDGGEKEGVVVEKAAARAAEATRRREEKEVEGGGRSPHGHQRSHAAGQTHQHGHQGGERGESRLASGVDIREESRQQDPDESRETPSREIRLQPTGDQQAIDLLQGGETGNALAALGAISQVLRFWPEKSGGEEQGGGRHPAEREEVMTWTDNV